MSNSIPSTSPPEFQILKTDSRLRVRTPAHQREELLKLYDRGSLTAKAFADTYGIKYPTFAAWLQKRRRVTGTAANEGSVEVPRRAQPLQWVEALPPRHLDLPCPPEALCCLEFPHGVRLALTDQAQLPLAAKLISLLSRVQS
jgi:hypothetical protein